ncbi:SRPBCC family protein [Mycobacterium colombiense]|uniref:Polyketide cyclase / dehydrase and lipid transport n=1 Tax=Mycobacterium colombiense CECT 3035 TaxID=1041522 RepID=J4TID8_9MYCO|nr:SRPBCC family protein [Mycobacterium colombiense]EJO89253.1 hypothetical protein MCOL_V213425 [Mycobacterium colombiense CECT 3035]
MYTLHVTKMIAAPIDEVFDAYTDHERLSEVFGVRSCRVTRPGDTERNGLGAVRELDCGPIRLCEEITGFERPHRMQYRIRDSRPRADHRYGQVDFIETAQGTQVTWTTIFGIQAPLIGKVLDPAFGIGFGVAFRLVLRNVERRVLTARNVDASRGGAHLASHRPAQRRP